nr:MAG TPA: hypothetical protein [Caudoviricetes sp.]
MRNFGRYARIELLRFYPSNPATDLFSSGNCFKSL